MDRDSNLIRKINKIQRDKNKRLRSEELAIYRNNKAE
jgi:hypothetical protein